MNFNTIISDIRNDFDHIPNHSESTVFYYNMVSLSLTEKPYTAMPKHTVLSYVKFWIESHAKERPNVIRGEAFVQYAYASVRARLFLLEGMLTEIVSSPGYWKVPKSTEPEYIKISKQERT